MKIKRKHQLVLGEEGREKTRELEFLEEKTIISMDSWFAAFSKSLSSWVI